MIDEVCKLSGWAWCHEHAEQLGGHFCLVTSGVIQCQKVPFESAICGLEARRISDCAIDTLKVSKAWWTKGGHHCLVTGGHTKPKSVRRWLMKQIAMEMAKWMKKSLFQMWFFIHNGKVARKKTYLHDSLTVTKVMSSRGEIWLKPPIINVQTHFEVLLSFSQIHGTWPGFCKSFFGVPIVCVSSVYCLQEFLRIMKKTNLFWAVWAGKNPLGHAQKLQFKGGTLALSSEMQVY